jgi:pimeloyl-ACP methyl ester carboxylesterase
MLTLRATVALIVLLVLAGCGSEEITPPESRADPQHGAASSPAATEGTTEEAVEDELDIVEGMFEVDGHDLYARCAGHGAPTVLYLHGWMTHKEVRAVDNGLWVEGHLHAEHRFCGYERRNTGRSETVPGPQTPAEVVADIAGLTEALGEKGPFILLGASFGGMVAHAFSVTHPDQVAGIVLLDALFPDELALDRYLDPEWTACSPRNRRLDERRSLERISQCDLYRYCSARVDREPDVPLTYLASRQERWDRSERATPEYARRILDTQRSYVERWSPGRFVWVDAPHFMEPEIPIRIAHAITSLTTER